MNNIVNELKSVCSAQMDALDVSNVRFTFAYKRKRDKQCSGYANPKKRSIYLRIPHGVLCVENFKYVVQHELQHIRDGSHAYNGKSHSKDLGMSSTYSCLKLFACDNLCVKHLTSISQGFDTV